MEPIIEKVVGREILDSRGNPTVEVEVQVAGHNFRAAVPSGASTGQHEAIELRDGDEKRYNKKGVRKAVDNVNNSIAPKLKGWDCREQRKIDLYMKDDLDGTKNKGKLGANAILGVSMAVARAAAALTHQPLHAYLASLYGNDAMVLPAPQLNVMNGGRHAGMENDIQEHMIVPIGAENFREAIRMGAEIYHTLYKLIKSRYGSHGIHLGDEGGFVPFIPDVKYRLELITEAIRRAGYESKVMLALDAAASEFYYDGTYVLGDRKFTPKELIEFYRELADEFPIVSLEDGMAEDDWEGWSASTTELGDRMQIVGDDLLVTNPERIKRAIKEGSANALLLKVNQIGTVTESIDSARLCRDAGWGIVVSHRSGETEDSFIADLVVALGCGQSKFGAPARSDRNAKYNQLLRIEEQLGDKALYGGKTFKYRRA